MGEWSPSSGAVDDHASTGDLFLLPFGLGHGGTLVRIQLPAVESFGLRDVGEILGAITLLETLGGFAGSVITGRLAGSRTAIT